MLLLSSASEYPPPQLASRRPLYGLRRLYPIGVPIGVGLCCPLRLLLDRLRRFSRLRPLSPRLSVLLFPSGLMQHHRSATPPAPFLVIVRTKRIPDSLVAKLPSFLGVECSQQWFRRSWVRRFFRGVNVTMLSAPPGWAVHGLTGRA